MTLAKQKLLKNSSNNLGVYLPAIAGGLVRINQSFLIVGGNSKLSNSFGVQMSDIDPVTNKLNRFMPLCDLPFKILNPTIVKVGNELHILSGSVDSTPLSEVVVVDLDTLKWRISRVNTLPVRDPVIVKLDTDSPTVLVLGGSHDNMPVNKGYQSDLINPWRRSRSMLCPISEATGIYHKNHVYIFGGRLQNGALNTGIFRAQINKEGIVCRYELIDTVRLNTDGKVLEVGLTGIKLHILDDWWYMFVPSSTIDETGQPISKIIVYRSRLVDKGFGVWEKVDEIITCYKTIDHFDIVRNDKSLYVTVSNIERSSSSIHELSIVNRHVPDFVHRLLKLIRG